MKFNSRISCMLIVMVTVSLLLPAVAVAQRNYFGAIAYAPTGKALGWSYNFASRKQAEREALKNCNKHGGGCKIANWFRNACGAIAIGTNGGWGADWGVSLNQAKSKTVKQCGKYDSGCKVVRWVCTTTANKKQFVGSAAPAEPNLMEGNENAQARGQVLPNVY